MILRLLSAERAAVALHNSTGAVTMYTLLPRRCYKGKRLVTSSSAVPTRTISPWFHFPFRTVSDVEIRTVADTGYKVSCRHYHYEEPRHACNVVKEWDETVCTWCCPNEYPTQEQPMPPTVKSSIKATAYVQFFNFLVRLLLKCGLYAMFWVCKPREMSLARCDMCSESRESSPIARVLGISFQSVHESFRIASKQTKKEGQCL